MSHCRPSLHSVIRSPLGSFQRAWRVVLAVGALLFAVQLSPAATHTETITVPQVSWTGPTFDINGNQTSAGNYTTYNNTFSYNKFNPALGTLTGAEICVTVTGAGNSMADYYNWSGQNRPTVNVNHTQGIQFTINGGNAFANASFAPLFNAESATGTQNFNISTTSSPGAWLMSPQNYPSNQIAYSTCHSAPFWNQFVGPGTATFNLSAWVLGSNSYSPTPPGGADTTADGGINCHWEDQAWNMTVTINYFYTPNACSLNSLSFTTGSCNDNSTPTNSSDDWYYSNITVSYANKPASGTLGLSGAGLHTVPASVNVGSIGSSSYTFNNVKLRANGGSPVVTATFSADPSCTLTDTASAVASCSVPVCSVNSLSFTTGSCNDNSTPTNSSDDWYYSNITVSYANKPASGTLGLSGAGLHTVPASVNVGSIGSSSYTFNNVKLRANGGSPVVTATFSADPSCTLTDTASAVASCSVPVCSVNSLSFTTGSCNDNSTPTNSSDDWYYSNITVSYANKPASGTLGLSGAGLHTVPASVNVGSIGSSSYTFNNVKLRANGGSPVVTATFSADPSCTLTDTASAVASCSVPVCSVNSLSFTTGSCNDNSTPTNSSDDWYYSNITVSYANKPASGTLGLSGAGLHTVPASVNVGSIGSSSYTFNNVKLRANGGSPLVTAIFSADPTCALSDYAAALSSCSTPSCSVSAIDVYQGTCNNNGSPTDSADDYYSATVVVYFNNKPASGSLTLTGPAINSGTYSVAVSSTSTTTSHTFSSVFLKANGASNALTAAFTADPACTLSTTDTSLAHCSSSPISDFGDYTGFAVATQTANGAIRIGTLATDAEASSPANSSATGDDLVGDDEDLTMPSLTVGTATTLSIPVAITPASLSGSTSRIIVFADWNGDGDVGDTNETLAVQSVTSSGTKNFSLTPPAGTTPGTKYLRIRFAEGSTTPAFTGSSALKGEVEDYAITVNGTATSDYGDYAGFAVATQTANNAIRIGTLATDAEAASPANSTATGDDLVGDDEDLTMPSFTVGTATTLSVPVTITPASLSGSTSRIIVFADWNADGDASDTGETQAVQSVTSSGTRTFSLTPPVGTTPGTKYLRIRFAEGSTTPTFSGTSALKGEVEDYAVTVNASVSADFSDYVGLPEASSTVVSNLRIGALVDAEVAAQLNGAALGDDYDNTDDEDGVAFGIFTPGQAATLTITATNNTGANAYLNAWADWNEDGDVSDSGEALTSVSPATQITVSSSATANRTFTFNFTVPVTARGSIPVRVRLTSVSAPGGDGQDGNGEVEDHIVTLATTCASQLSIYNAIVSNTLATPSDIQGRSVIKSVTGLDSFSAGHFVTGTSTLAVAVQTGFSAGGPINIVNGSLWAPSVAALGGRSINYPGGGALVTSPAFDFATVFNNIAAESVTYAAMPTNSTITIPSSPAVTYLTVGSGVANGTPAVFSIDGPTLFHNNNVQTIDLNLNGKTPSAIIINITGTSVTYDWSGENVNVLRDTTWRPKILWHFPTATTVNLNKPLYGSILAPNATLTAIGGANEGSIMVKDYQGTIAVKLPLWTGGSSICTDASDYGDSLLFPDASSTVVGSIKLGATGADVDAVPASNAAATADDLAGTDDEDGLISATLNVGSTGSVTISRSNTSGANAYLNAWIDWDGDGFLGETNGGVSDQVITNVTVPTGTSGNLAYSVTVPAGISASTVHLRLRLTSTSSPGTSGYSGNGEVEDHAVTIGGPITDFGDYTGFAAATQTANSAIRIGTLATDAEAADPSNSTATGDDLVGDDEDLTMPSFTVGTATTLSIPVTITPASLSGSTSRIRVFADWNGDGDVADTNETLTVQSVTSSGTKGFSLTPPVGTTPGTKYLRIRFAEGSTTPAFSGTSALKGEVEDYAVTVNPVPTLDFGDYSRYGLAASTVNTTLRIGALVDAESAATTNTSANGDDVTGLADEDGVTLPSLPSGQNFREGVPTSINVSVTNTTGSPAYLNAWVDWNRDNDTLDAGEQISANVLIPTGTSNGTQTLSFTPPTVGDGVGGGTAVRLRLTNVQNPGATGTIGTGEVQDHYCTLAPGLDYGDMQGGSGGTTGLTIYSGVRLGALIDAEAADQPNATATGDDTVGVDDDDGVTIPSLTAGQTATIQFSITNNHPGLTQAVQVKTWIDWNRSGIFNDDSGGMVESQFLSAAVPAGVTNGTYTINVTPPAGVATGVPIAARFNLMPQGTGHINGNATHGEIEDYMITVNPALPTADYGDFNGFPAASQEADVTFFMGAAKTDTESAALANATGSGDDADGTDDEDITMPSFTVGTATNLVIPTAINTASFPQGRINVFVDWNGDGDVSDASETQTVQSVTSSGNKTFVIAPPIGTTPGTKYPPHPSRGRNHCTHLQRHQRAQGGGGRLRHHGECGYYHRLRGLEWCWRCYGDD
jgi:choice-of-anchor A domain-containing protein